MIKESMDFDCNIGAIEMLTFKRVTWKGRIKEAERDLPVFGGGRNCCLLCLLIGRGWSVLPKSFRLLCQTLDARLFVSFRVCCLPEEERRRKTFGLPQVEREGK